MNKEQHKIYMRYLLSDKHNLYEAYDSFSSKKAEACEYCKKLCSEKNGRGLKVIGANTSFFSAGFLFEENGRKKLMYITKGYNRVIDIEEA